MPRASLLITFSALMALASGCGGQTGEIDYVGTVETVETSLALDEMSDLGFTAQEVLDRVGPVTYDAALQETEGEFGPGSLSDQMLQASPFSVAALSTPAAVFQETVINDEVTERWVVIRGAGAVVSEDSTFNVVGQLELHAEGLTDAEINWNDAAGAGPTGVMPSWVDEQVASFHEGSTCPASVPTAILKPRGPLDGLELLLNIENADPDCGYGGNVAALDLQPVE